MLKRGLFTGLLSRHCRTPNVVFEIKVLRCLELNPATLPKIGIAFKNSASSTQTQIFTRDPQAFYDLADFSPLRPQRSIAATDALMFSELAR